MAVILCVICAVWTSLPKVLSCPLSLQFLNGTVGVRGKRTIYVILIISVLFISLGLL